MHIHMHTTRRRACLLLAAPRLLDQNMLPAQSTHANQTTDMEELLLHNTTLSISINISTNINIIYNTTTNCNSTMDTSIHRAPRDQTPP